MSLPRFDLNLLAALDALLSERSVTAAARRVGVTQSAMSGMLARLREQFKDRLLVRVGRSLEVTARGAMLQPEVRQILLRAQNLLVADAELNLAETSRCLRIMASEHSAILILPLVFKRAAETAPQLKFEILSIEAPAHRVATDDVDLCLTGDPIEGIGKAASDVLRTRTILQEKFVAVMDKKHPAAGQPVTYDVLHRYPHVATQFPGVSRTVEEIVISKGKAGFTVVVRVPNFLAVGPAVAGSERIGIIPSMLAPLMTSVWSLRAMALPEEVPASGLRALWHVRNDADPVHQWLRKTIEDSCAQLASRTAP